MIDREHKPAKPSGTAEPTVGEHSPNADIFESSLGTGERRSAAHDGDNAPTPPAPPRASGPDSSPEQPLFRYGPFPLWLLAASFTLSGGLYLPHFAYALARDLGCRRGRSVLFAVGSVTPGLGIWVFYRLARRIDLLASKLEIGATSLARRATVGFAVACVGFLIAHRFESFWSYPIAGLLVAGAPMSVQPRINRLKRTAPSRWPKQRALLAPLHWLGCFAVLCIFGLHLSASRLAIQRFLSAPLTAGSVIEGSSGLIQLTLPGSGWRKASPGTLADGTAELELFGKSHRVWAIAFSYPEQKSLDSLTDARRAAIKAELPLNFTFEEHRQFRKGSPLLPYSIARYGAKLRDGTQISYQVCSLSTPQASAELIVYSRDPNDDRETLELLDSLRITGTKQAIGVKQ